MSAGEWIAAVGLLITVLGLLGGGVWWMSALHSDVKAIRAYLAEVVGGDKEDKRVIWLKLDSHTEDITDVKNRVLVLENRRD